MLRIPNPGSKIDIFVRIFRDLHAVLKDKTDFDLEEMKRALVETNNVASQGAFGKEALRRSFHKDKSRDRIYNQAKMYAELYRTLGWLQSTSSALRYAFSWLGEHVACTHDPKPLTVECLLGMSYPNDVLGVRGNHSVRVFPAILKTAAVLGGRITRDEMIVGPLSIQDDRDSSSFFAMIAMLKRCRTEPGRMKAEIAALSDIRKISPVTMENYTRFPIAAVQWAGWCEKTSKSALTLTAEGKATIEALCRFQWKLTSQQT